MKYRNIDEGVFISRPNRFIAKVLISGREETVHIKNTGRCRELLVKGRKVYLERSDNPARRTMYDLVAVEKPRSGLSPLLINMDSQIPNKAAEEWLRKGGIFSENAVIRREVKCGSSRFDFCIEDCGRISYLEVKGVTLEQDGIAYFPDAPTERGVKHIGELIKCRSEGFGAYVLFVIQMKGVRKFRPNDITHKEFGEILRYAHSQGVELLAYDCIVTPDSIEIDENIPIEL